MGLRLRKSIKLFPGVRINLSKSGVSTSIGPRGATVNLRGTKRRVSIGAPGTGVGFTKQYDATDQTEQPTPPRQFSAWWLVIMGILLIIGVTKCAA